MWRVALALSGLVVLAGVADADPDPKPPDVETRLAARFAADRRAQAIALELYRRTGDVADVGPDEIIDGGYRGQIHLVPELPIGRYRRHLVWVAAALHDVDAFFAAQFPEGTAAPRYRWRQLALRFVRSVGKRTPSAFASAWAVEYNVAGSLHTSERAVRETLFHEVFHLNDEGHGDWSARTLERDYDAILRRCRGRHGLACFAPYAPNDTVVRGGTFYAFQQGNGAAVHEYAAELAVRYLDEQTAMRTHGKLGRRAFKCGPAENARAWRALVDEFFGGRDLVPACPGR